VWQIILHKTQQTFILVVLRTMERITNPAKSIVLALAAVISIALVAVIGSSAQAPGAAAPENYTLGGYLPTWLKTADSIRVSKTTGVNQLFIAFVEPDAKGDIPAPQYTPATLTAIRQLGAHADRGVFISVGGHGATPEESAAIKAGFAWGLDNPVAFAANIYNAVRAAEHETGLTNIGVDIDFEYPSPAQAHKLPALFAALKEKGIKHTAMAVAAGGANAGGVKAVAGELANAEVQLNVMAYDMHGPWSATSGPITTRGWTMASVDAWVAASGNAQAISVGFPSYCYKFVGANKSGDTFDTAASAHLAASAPLYLRQLPGGSMFDNAALGTTESTPHGSWISCLSPAQAGMTMQAIRSSHPTIGGAFIWDMNGITGDYTASLTKRDR
jgi:GH18 family chitinase